MDKEARHHLKPNNLKIAHVHSLNKHQKTKQLDAAQVQQGATDGEAKNARDAEICDSHHVQNRSSAHVSHQSVLSHSESSWRQAKPRLDNKSSWILPARRSVGHAQTHSTARWQIHQQRRRALQGQPSGCLGHLRLVVHHNVSELFRSSLG